MVYLVGAGPGDPGLLTLRGLECLRKADVILADQLVNPILIHRFARADAEVIVRPPNRAGLDQDEINRILIDRAQKGKTVVRLKGGDPFIFGRGGEEAEVLQQAGLAFEVVPGVTAAVAVPAYAGIPLTHRGAAGAVAFATAHETSDKEGGAVAWEALARGANTLVLFMGVTHLAEVMAKLAAHGRAPETPVAVIEWGTTPRQKTVVGTLADIAQKAAALRPPALVVVGDVVGVRLDWFRPKKRVLVLSTREVASEVVEVVHVSPLQVVPRFADVKASLPRPARVLAFASEHAVDALLSALFSTGQDLRALHGVKLAAVGAATAARLAEHHLHADLTGSGGGSELAADIRRAGWDGPVRVLGAAFPQGGRSELAQGLRAAGYDVDSVEAYDTVPDREALQRAAREHQASPFDAIAFASPKGARAFLDVANPGAARVGAIGQTTRAALEAAGVTVDAVPAEPSLAALVDALADKIE